MQNLSMIACISKDRGIGQDGALLWRFNEDMQFFRQTTLHHPVIMGRKTFESIGRALPNRPNYVLSRGNFHANGVTVFHHPAELDQFLQAANEEVFIIGGAMLYNSYLSKAQKLYLTEVDAMRPADTFFPEFDHQKYTRNVIRTFTQDNINCEIVEYVRNDLS